MNEYCCLFHLQLQVIKQKHLCAINLGSGGLRQRLQLQAKNKWDCIALQFVKGTGSFVEFLPRHEN
jgi:hypothetical protein